MPQIGYYSIMQCHVKKLGSLEITIHDLQTYNEEKKKKTPLKPNRFYNPYKQNSFHHHQHEIIQKIHLCWVIFSKLTWSRKNP